TGESLGLAATDTGKPVEAHQHHNFGYNLPPLSSIDLLIDQEVTDWFNEKYPDAAAAGLGFFDALAIAGLSDTGATWATLEYLFGVPEDTVFNIAADVNVITNSYPDIFDAAFKMYLSGRGIKPFDAYTIWFMIYNLGKPHEDVSKLYNITIGAVSTIVDKITALYVPLDQIEQRLRTEWVEFFNSVDAVDKSGFENDAAYHKWVITNIFIPFIQSSKIRIPFFIELRNFIGATYSSINLLKQADPDWAKTLRSMEINAAVKRRAFSDRLWKLRYEGFYFNVVVNKVVTSADPGPEISPYDIDEILGILSETGEDGKSMLERATGFTRDEIRAITTEDRYSYGYGSEEIAVYEIFVKKSITEVRRFFLHLQKEGAPVITVAYDNLAYLKNICAYDNLYGTGTDLYAGRTGFATGRRLYSTRANLLDNGLTDTDINRLELKLLQNVYALTMDENGIGWIITDPAAIGFLQEAPGIYKAYLVDGAKIAKSFDENAMAAYYADANGPWVERGFVTEDFIAFFSSPTAIIWVEGLADENQAIKDYARRNIENALHDQGLLYNICLEGGIDIDAVSEVYGVF
ncbi:MAG: hypothetical protein KAQ99_06035, partial [Candidatus Aureabacteria bacterium]|nr:hypothetical protein [Candidatus Auribacterota bacterium]